MTEYPLTRSLGTAPPQTDELASALARCGFELPSNAWYVRGWDTSGELSRCWMIFARRQQIVELDAVFSGLENRNGYEVAIARPYLLRAPYWYSTALNSPFHPLSGDWLEFLEIAPRFHQGWRPLGIVPRPIFPTVLTLDWREEDSYE